MVQLSAPTSAPIWPVKRRSTHFLLVFPTSASGEKSDGSQRITGSCVHGNLTLAHAFLTLLNHSNPMRPQPIVRQSPRAATYGGAVER